MRFTWFILGLVFLTSVFYAKSVLLIIDASGSMGEYMPDGSQTRLDAAKSAAINLVQSSNDEFALMVYTDCDYGGDPYSGPISVWQDFTYDKSSLISKIQSITSQSMTPIANSIQEGETYLRQTRGTGTIVLLTDGEETCGYSSDIPPAISAATNNGISVHVIGFQLSDYSSQKLQQDVQTGGGKYYTADDEYQLTQAFQQATGDDTCCCSAFILLLLPLAGVLGKAFFAF
jgi:Ca-activated chloride channel family protein